jgi:ComF family protein
LRPAVVPPFVAHVARRALDVVLPPQCLGCGVVVDSLGSLCPACWRGLVLPGPPQCARCGLPLFERARAALSYDDASRRLILAFKHGDRTDAAAAYGRWLVRAGAELIADADLVAPVPLHWTRLFARRYNQAALLAHAVGRFGGISVVPDLLIRTRRTPSQGRLSPSQRRRNLRGAFRVRPAAVAGIAGRRVLLIDDVFTTGATVSACARTLLRAGAGAVDVLTLARVMRPAP